VSLESVGFSCVAKGVLGAGTCAQKACKCACVYCCGVCGEACMLVCIVAACVEGHVGLCVCVRVWVGC